MSLRKGPWPKGFKVCIFANGCFWGSEKGIWRLPGGGIFSTAVGYAGGYTPNPTYEEACSGRTGHTEAVQVVYDPEKVSLVDILRWFWEAHDPTQGNSSASAPPKFRFLIGICLHETISRGFSLFWSFR